MGETLYKIEFDGELSDGFSEEDVKIQLRNRFKLEEKKIARMFSGDPLILKKGVSLQEAEKFRETFLNIGVICTLHPLTPVPPSFPEVNAPAVAVDEAPAISPVPEPQETDKVGEELALLKVREVLGFTGKGLINPESDVQLFESRSHQSVEERTAPESIEESGGPEPREPVNTDSGEVEPEPEYMEVEKSPGPLSEMTPGETESDQAVSQFRIVFSGDTAPGRSGEEVKRSIAELLGIEIEDTKILFSHVPVVLKDGLSKDRAFRYRDQYRNAGVEVTLEPSDQRVGGFVIE